MDSKYYATQADLEVSKGLIAGLWALGLDGLVNEVAETKYHRYYLSNIAGNGVCLLLHDVASGKAVGVQGLIPRRFYVGDRCITGATLADFVVARGHRSLGPALKLMRTCIEVSKERFAFIYGTPNENARAILKRVGFHALGALTRYTKLIRSETFWRARLPPWMVPPVAVAVDAVIALADISRGWFYGRHLYWSEQSFFGTEFEKIWQGRGPKILIGDRSPDALQWRYPLSDPDGPWQVSLAMDRSSIPIGYVVWRNGDGHALISDFFVSATDGSFRALMQSFICYLRGFSVQRVSLEFFGCSSVTTALAACGFAPREQSSVVFIEHAHVGTRERHISSNTIFMTTFDRDHEN